MQEAAVRNMTKQPNRIERMVFMKLSRKLISMLLIAMFLVTSITATDVITPPLTPIAPPETEVQPLASHCYLEVIGVTGYWIERWVNNSLADAYFAPDTAGSLAINGNNIRTNGHPHLGSLSNVKNIAPGSSKRKVTDLSEVLNIDFENAVLVIDIDSPFSMNSVLPDAVQSEYYWVYFDSTATYYGDLICNP